MNTELGKILDPIQELHFKAALSDLCTKSLAMTASTTGSGKTINIEKMVNNFSHTGKKFLIVVPNRETKKRILDQFSKSHLKVSSYLEEGWENAQVIVGIINSIANPNRLRMFNVNDFEMVIFDEVHHILAPSYLRVFNYFKTIKKYGLTATPYRPDDKYGVVKLFKGISSKVEIPEAIEKGFYANPNVLSRCILTNSSIEGIISGNGEYKPRSLDKLIVSENRNNIIVDSYLEYGRKAMIENNLPVKTIGFAVTIKHAKRLVTLFKKKGISADFVCGNGRIQNIDKREKIMDTFRTTNKIEVLFTVSALGEGTDLPSVSCVLMVRPTRSNVLYCQNIGRGSRVIPGQKNQFIVLDFVDNTRRGFSPYILSSATDSKYTGSQIVTKYVNCNDPLYLNERVNAIQSIIDFDSNIRDFYETIEEFIAACTWLNINSFKSYLERYKEDPRLPSHPEQFYQEFKWGMIGGRDRSNIETDLLLILKFCEENNYRPNMDSQNEDEKKLGLKLSNYKKKNKKHKLIQKILKYPTYKLYKFHKRFYEMKPSCVELIGELKKSKLFHSFLCNDHGKFKSTIDRLLSNTWKLGNCCPTFGNMHAYDKIIKKYSIPIVGRKNNNETIFFSISNASRLTIIERANISAVLKGRKKTAGGYEWRYATEQEILDYRNKYGKLEGEE